MRDFLGSLSPLKSLPPSGGDVGHIRRQPSLDPVGETRWIICGSNRTLGKEASRAPAVVEKERFGRLADPVHPRPLEFGVERTHADMEPRVVEHVGDRVGYVGIIPSYAPSLESSRQDRQFPGQSGHDERKWAELQRRSDMAHYRQGDGQGGAQDQRKDNAHLRTCHSPEENCSWISKLVTRAC